MSGKQIGLRFSREIACLHEMAETEAEFNYIILWDYRFQFLITEEGVCGVKFVVFFQVRCK